jgi:glycosyltransferase involved in cell wall biosynthesis
MNPLVSVLIPAYNAERWIRETLASAVDQDYPRIEVILVNDGSTDRTAEVASQFARRNVKIINQANAGGPAARNTALQHAQGDYIQWLDHDDLLAPDKISRQLHKADTTNDRLLLCGPFGVFYYRPEKAKFRGGPLCRDMQPVEYFLTKFSGNTYFQSGSWLVSRKLTGLAGPWWNLRSPDDDGEYFCRVVAASERIQFVPEAKSYWRVGNSGSFSGAWKKSPAALEAAYQSTVRCIEHFRRLEDSERTRKACVKFLQDRMIYFYPDSGGILERMGGLAAELGGSLRPPPLSWKYQPVRAVFGWSAAKRVAIIAPGLRVSVVRAWDRFWYQAGAGRGIAAQAR